MPIRSTPIETNQFYHVYNKSLNQLTIFPTASDYNHALMTLWFYQKPQSLSLHKYLQLKPAAQQEYLSHMTQSENLVEIACLSLMPNHYHLIIKQNVDGGISRYMSDIQNSMTRFFNIKHKHQGSIFISQFKALHIETNNNFLYVSRYVLINPVMAYLTTFEGLRTYPYSSYCECADNPQFCHTLTQPNYILKHFKDISRFNVYIRDQIDYQRRLTALYHLLFE